MSPKGDPLITIERQRKCSGSAGAVFLMSKIALDKQNKCGKILRLSRERMFVRNHPNI